MYVYSILIIGHSLINHDVDKGSLLNKPRVYDNRHFFQAYISIPVFHYDAKNYYLR